MTSRPFRQGGFTLIELIVVLAILVILITMAIPGFNQLLGQSARKDLISKHFNAFAFARSQAALEMTIVTLCPIAADGSCHDDWNKPVSVFPDDDGNGRPDGGIVWRVFDLESRRFSIFSRTGGTGQFRYSPDGMTYGLTGSLVICPEPPATDGMTYIALSKSGRLRKEADRDSDGVITTHWGATITCPRS